MFQIESARVRIFPFFSNDPTIKMFAPGKFLTARERERVPSKISPLSKQGPRSKHCSSTFIWKTLCNAKLGRSQSTHTYIHITCIETCTVEAHSVAEISSFSAFRFSHDDARVRTCAKLKRLVRSQPRAFHQLFSTLDVFASMDIFQTRSFFFPPPLPRV